MNTHDKKEHLKEIGRIGQYRYGGSGSSSIFFEEFLPELRGAKAVQVYTEMADNDATVGAILFAIEMLMRNVDFKIEPGGNSKKDKEAAEFVESCLNDMERTWADTLSEILSFLTYGWSYHEIVYKRRGGHSSSPILNSKYNDGLIGWRKLPIRSQDTLYGWEYQDQTDELLGMTQMPPPDYGQYTIPIEKALHFRTRSRKDNPEGRSILRTAYRCFDDNTEILTKNGWKPGTELTTNDSVATLNPTTKEIEYQKPSKVHLYDHSGEMVHMYSRFIDILVTDNHRMWVKKDKAEDFCIIEAKDVKKSHSVMRYGIWEGKNKETYTIPKCVIQQHFRDGTYRDKETLPEIMIDMKVWMAFLGLFLSEGHTWQRKNGNKQRIVGITQNEGEKADKIRELLNRMPFSYYEHKSKGGKKITFEIFSIQLFNELRPLGKAADKYIPSYVKELSPEYLRILIEWLIFGDGMQVGKTDEYSGTMTYGTASEQLADDIQEIALLAGYEAQKRTSEAHKRHSRNNNNFYCVSICSPKDRKIKNIDTVDYSGKVWCPTTKNGIIYVRRNGKPAWVGNCYYFKKRLEEIEGYGVERDLAGFPVLYAPADLPIWDDDPDMIQTLARAEQIVSNIRRDAREGLVLPGGENGWKLELITSGSRRQFDTSTIIDRYDKRIATSVLADFVMLGQQQVGSFALADSKTKIFALAIGTYLDVICEVFNNQGIPRLIDINGEHFKGITEYPYMTHGDIDEQDLQQFATFVKEMIGAGVIQPDEELEKEVRRVGGLPEKLETDTPKDMQPGETGPQGGQNGKDNSYKITSIIDKYQGNKITRDMAAQLLQEIGINGEKAEFYLQEADKAHAEKQQGGAGADKRTEGIETPTDDEKDAQEAAEAKKGLHRLWKIK